MFSRCRVVTSSPSIPMLSAVIHALLVIFGAKTDIFQCIMAHKFWRQLYQVFYAHNAIEPRSSEGFFFLVSLFQFYALVYSNHSLRAKTISSNKQFCYLTPNNANRNK